MRTILEIKQRTTIVGAIITPATTVKEYVDGTLDIEQEYGSVIIHPDDLLAIADAIRAERVAP